MRFTMRMVLLALMAAWVLPAANIFSVSIDVYPLDPYGSVLWSVTADPSDATTYAITNYRLTGAESEAPRDAFLLSNAVTSDNDAFNYTASFARIEYLLTIDRPAFNPATFMMQLDIPGDPLGVGAWIAFNLPSSGPIGTQIVDVQGVTSTTVTEMVPEPASAVLTGCGISLLAAGVRRRSRSTRV